MFIIELLIYVLFAWVMYTLAKESCQKDDSPTIFGFNAYIWAYMLFFTIISAIRWRVGVDSQSYINIFIRGEVRDDSTEILWDSLVKGVYDNGLPFYIGTGVVALFQIFCLCKGLKNAQYLLIWLPIVLFGGRYYIDLMNGVRQMMVMCGFFYLSRYIVDRKVVQYIVGIFILSLIHHSALLLLPVLLLAYIPWEKIDLADKKYFCLGCLAVCFILGRTPAFQGVMHHLETILAFTGYEQSYGDYYATVLSGEYSEALSLGPIMISYLLCSVAIILYGPELKEFYHRKIPCFDIWYFCSLFYACGYFLVCNLSHMMIRPFQYFEIFQAILLTMLAYLFYRQGEERRYYLYGLITIIWSCTFIGVYKDTGAPIEFTTYKTFFEHL